jgi:hypothetical protein
LVAFTGAFMPKPSMSYHTPKQGLSRRVKKIS